MNSESEEEDFEEDEDFMTKEWGGWTSSLKKWEFALPSGMYLLNLKSELWTKQVLPYLYFIYDCFMYLVTCHVLNWVYILLSSMFVTCQSDNSDFKSCYAKMSATRYYIIQFLNEFLLIL
jgi:hypothetical protein